MSALEILRPPWIASARSSRWLALVVLVALALAEVAILTLAPHPARAVSAGIVWCCAVALWWLLVVPNALWLARDAAVLQMPRVRRLANASVLAHALLTVAVPATVFALLLGHPLAWFVACTFAVTGWLLFLLLPSGVWIGIWVVFVAVTSLHLVEFRMPGIDELARYGVVPALALIALAVSQWFRVLRMDAPAEVGLGKPVIWNMRVRARSGFLGIFSRNADAAMARGAYAWFSPAVDLRGVAPAHPVRTIRVALGRNVMPQTLASRARTMAIALLLVALVIGQAVVQAAHSGGLRHAFDALLLAGHGNIGMAGVLAVVLPIITVTAYGWPIQQRWRTANQELALLWLLPRLADSGTRPRSAVAACLAKAAYVATFECIALVAIALWIRVPAVALVFALLCSAATLALAAIPILAALGGRPMSGWLLAALTIVTAGVGTIAVALTFVPGGTGAETVGYLVLALLILLAILVAPGWRGWRALRRRPHPFLGAAP